MAGEEQSGATSAQTAGSSGSNNMGPLLFRGVTRGGMGAGVSLK